MLLFGSSLLLSLCLSAPPPGEPADETRLRPGLTAAEVLQRHGEPARIARQVIYRRCLEQWIYDAPLSVRIEFDSPLGQPSQILTVQPLGPRKP